MEAQAPKRSGLGRLLWLLVIVAIVVVWYLYRPGRPGQQAHVAPTAEELRAADRAALPDEILVDLVDDASAAQIAALERDLGLELTLVSDESRDEAFFRAHVPADRRDALLAALAARPEVELAEPDARVQLSPEELAPAPAAPAPAWEGFPNDPKYRYQWHLDQIGMPRAWKLADGGGVIVAVLDTGVGYENHGRFRALPDLAGIEFVAPYDFVDNDRHADDDHGHGSHVTGTIAQATHNGVGVAGIARNVRIMPLKVLSGSGSGSIGGIADAIRYAADNGAKVINMSLGGPLPSRALRKAVQYAHDKGVVVVCAAGNDGKGKVGYPAAYPGAIAVSATQFDESVTFYSNHGKDIDVAAPGGNTRVDQNGDGQPDGVLQNTIKIGDPTVNDYYGYMGTSMASPHVAGVAALIVGEGVTDPDMVEQILKDTARRPGHQAFSKDKYGAGIVDAPAAILAARAGAGGWQLGLGLLMAGAVAASVRRRAVKLGAGYLAGVVLGASGLFFLPYVAPGVASATGMELLTRGLPSWDLALLGPTGHGNALFFSALLPLGLLALGFGVPRLRAALAGVSIGVAAHLAFFAAVPLAPIQYVPSVFGLGSIWLAVNALACLGLARLALRR